VDRYEGELTIRPAAEPDVEVLFGVYQACEDFLALGPVAASSPEMVRADMQTSQSEGGVFSGVYLGDGTPVGVLDYVPGNFRGRRDTAYVALLMIAQPHRSRGIGSRVLEWVEGEVGKDPAVTRIRMGVMVNNPSAIRFWQNRGFKIVSGPEQLADRTTVYRLEKLLLRNGYRFPHRSRTPKRFPGLRKSMIRQGFRGGAENADGDPPGAENASSGRQKTEMRMDRAEQAVENMRGGFNCAQSIVKAFSPELGVEQPAAVRMATAFGGGFGRCGQVCGALSGAAIVLGARLGNSDGADTAARDRAYAAAQRLADAFQREHGTVLCRELTGFVLRDPESMKRAQEQNVFTEKCPAFLRTTARILGEILAEG
jgi:C_GCAxxG_C_C family probable redox protein